MILTPALNNALLSGGICDKVNLTPKAIIEIQNAISNGFSRDVLIEALQATTCND